MEWAKVVDNNTKLLMKLQNEVANGRRKRNLIEKLESLLRILM